MSQNLKYLDNIGLERVVENTKKLVNTSYSNPNLLDNPNFADPINQRGKTKSNEAGYFIDRWYFLSSNDLIILNDEYITMQSILGDCFIFQRLEDPEKYNGLTLTFSIMYRGNGAAIQIYGVNKDGVYINKLENISNTDKWNVASITVTIPEDIHDIDELRPTIGVTTLNGIFDVKAAKLELGDKQTLAHQDSNGNWVLNDAPPNKALELVKCQRYFITNKNDILNLFYGIKVYGSHIMVAIPGNMRVTPTAIINPNNLTSVYINDEWHPINLIKIYNVSNFIILVYSIENLPFIEGMPYTMLNLPDLSADL